MKQVQDGRAHGEKHWNSDYLGPHGAVAYARHRFDQAVAEAPFYGRRLEQHDPRMGEIKARQALVALISTLCSAIKPTLMTFHVVLAYQLLSELRKRVLKLKKTYGYEGLGPTEMEVTLAALTRGWHNHPDWVKEDIFHLARKILVHPETSSSTRLLTMARMLSQKDLPEADCKKYRKQLLIEVSYAYSAERLEPGVEWSTMARVAYLLNDTQCMHFFAEKDGRRDVLLKYGPPKLRMQAIMAKLMRTA